MGLSAYPLFPVRSAAGMFSQRGAFAKAAQKKGRTSSPPQDFRTHRLACYPLEGQEEVGVHLKVGLLD
jgi:hypothetical protein